MYMQLNIIVEVTNVTISDRVTFSPKIQENIDITIPTIQSPAKMAEKAAEIINNLNPNITGFIYYSPSLIC